MNLNPKAIKAKIFKHAFGVNYRTGRQKETTKHFVRPFFWLEWKTGKQSYFKASASYEVLRHIENIEQLVFELNYEFSSDRGIGLRVFRKGKKWLPYLAFWEKKSEAGVWPSVYFTIGESNPYVEKPDQKKVAMKTEFRFSL